MRSTTTTGADWRFRAGVVALTIACLMIGILWSIVTPAFSTTDERSHVNSVLRLMQGGGWPAAHSTGLVEGTVVAAAEAGYPVEGIDALDELPARENRSAIGDLDAEVPETFDNMTQHPPGYYGLMAGVLTVLGAAEWRWDQLVLGMRVLSMAIAALTVPCIIGAVRLAGGSRMAALAGGLVVLVSPQFFHVLGLVTNDALATTIGACLIMLMVRTLAMPERLRSSTVLLGITLGVGLFTKGLLIAAIPVVLLVLLVAAIRSRSGVWGRTWPWLGGGAIAFALGGWWYLRNRLVYGTFQPSLAGDGRADVPWDGYSLAAFVERWSARLSHTMWGSMRQELDLPGWLTVTLSVGSLAVIVAALVVSRRRGMLALLLLMPLLTTAIFTFHAWEIFYGQDLIAGVQGRYLFASLGIVAIAATMVVARVPRVPRMLRMAAVVVWSLVAAGVAAGGLLFAFDRLWGVSERGRGTALEAMASASAATVPGIVALAVGAAVLGALAVGLSVSLAERTARPALASA